MVLPQLSLGVAAAFFLFGWTNPVWTQRKFKVGENRDRLVLRSRKENMEQLHSFISPDTPMDLLVIGGGAVGTGVALDATLRGLNVGLVEMQDYASGTSSRSTKLIHGGIRYLEKAVLKMDLSQLRLVAEALRERGIMIHQAPHLCQPLPTLLPCYDVFDLIKYYAGIKLYDLVGAYTRGTLKYSSFVSPYETLRLFPYIRTTSPTNSALLGSIAYYDGQMNDARLCLTLGMTASALGAAVTNYAQVTGIKVVLNQKDEKVVKTTVLDRISEEEFSVYSRAVVNAGGPFASQIEDLHQGVKEKKISSRPRSLPSLGTHIVVERRYCPRDYHAMVVPSSDGRVVFTIPWLGACLMGTTDIPCEVSTDPRPSPEEVQLLLDSVKPYVGTVPKEAILSSWAGIRPLVAPSLPSESAKGRKNKGLVTDTQSVVREHIISVDNDLMMVSVRGGKWTTYRKIAEEALDTTINHFFSNGVKKAIKPCSTEEIVLLGGREFDKVPGSPFTLNSNESGGSQCRLPEDIHHHLKYTYGDRYFDMIKMFEVRKPNPHYNTPSERINGRIGVQNENLLLERLIEKCETAEHEPVKAFLSSNETNQSISPPVTKGEVIWASRNEHAEHIMDVLARRTRMAFVHAKDAKEVIPKVADIMAIEKGWSKAQKKREIDLAYASIESFMVGIPPSDRKNENTSVRNQ